MFTKNFKQLMLARANDTSTNPTFTLRDNTTSSLYDCYNYLQNKIIGTIQAKTRTELEASSALSQCVIALGTGDTAATANDIDLDAIVTETDFSVTNVAYNLSLSGDSKMYLTAYYQYNGSEEVSIKEIGLFQGVGTSVSALFAREVLDSPITVNNGDTFAVSMAIG